MKGGQRQEGARGNSGFGESPDNPSSVIYLPDLALMLSNSTPRETRMR